LRFFLKDIQSTEQQRIVCLLLPNLLH
jgi:hypothetical protein